MSKSLEIVNEKIEWCHECGTPAIAIGLDGLQQIQQSLEVLEIIRKKRVDMKLLAMFFVALTTNEILFSYNSNCGYEDEKLTLEELLKLKQWLEENRE